MTFAWYTAEARQSYCSRISISRDGQEVQGRSWW